VKHCVREQVVEWCIVATRLVAVFVSM